MIINVGASAGTVGFCTKKFWSSDGCYCIDEITGIISKYLYQYMCTKEHYIKSQVRTAGIPTLDYLPIQNLVIPIPSLSRQQEIVDILDKFELVIANLKEERELRRQQYEYYREKL